MNSKFNYFLPIILVLCSSLYTQAQTTEAESNLKKVNADSTDGWKKGGVANITFTQVYLDNWVAGGQNSISINGLISLYANYRKESMTWENNLDLGYGVLRQGSDEGELSAPWVKTDDKIDFTSKYGRKAKKNWYYAGLLNFKSQMADGFELPNDSIPISTFMAPAYLLGAIGMDYKSKGFSAFLSPVTLKTTFVLDDDLANAGAFGVEAAEIDTATGNIVTSGKKVRTELGGYIKLQYKKDDIIKNVNLLTKLDIFSNYLENPDVLDVTWEVLIAMKVNKYLTATLNTIVLYDQDISHRAQFKEVFGAGLSVKF